MPWIVKLVKSPKFYAYRRDYFPRKFHYKKDAEWLKKEVESQGGEATVTKAK